jgi:hypothetical protein
LTRSRSGVLLDAEPRWLTAPRGSSPAAGDAVELAASAGLLLDPAQRLALEIALRERRDGKWAAFEVGVIEPRQNGKGGILEARELAGLFLFGERLLLHSAHEFKTAQEAFLRVLALIQSTRDLERMVSRVRTSHGEEGIELKSGARLRFVARSRGSGRGFSGDAVFLDEAYNLSDKALAALMPTMSARPNPQLWYTSSAPLPTAESAVLRRFCRRGRKGASRLAYIEYAAAANADLDDQAAWAEANPAFGRRIFAEFIETERAAMSDEDFARERLGIWRDDEDREYVIPLATWDRRSDPDSQAAEVCFAFDVSPDRSSAAIGAAGRRADGRMHLEVVDHRPGTGWVAARLAELKARWNPPVVACDATGPAGALLNDVTAAGVEVKTASTRDHQQACGAFYDDVMDDRSRHTGEFDGELRAALAGADRRPVGDAWLWSRKSSTVDISPLVAVTLASWAATLPVEDAGPADFFVI